MNNSLPNIKVVNALGYLLDQLKNTNDFKQKKIEEVIDNFLARLPQFMQGAIKAVA